MTTDGGSKRQLAANSLETYFSLPAGEGDRLLDHVDIVTLAGGDWLFHQGDPGDSLFLLFRGRLEAVVESTVSRVLGEILPGESVGEVGLLTGEVRSAGVRAIRDSALIRIGPAQFSELASNNHQVVLNLASHVARRLHQNTVGQPRSGRAPTQICLVNLHATASREAANALVSQIRQWGSALEVSLDALGSTDAPSAPRSPDDTVSDEFAHWLGEQELLYDHVILRCEVTDSHWLSFCCRQADSTLLIADRAGSIEPLPVDRKHQRHLALGLFHEGDIEGTARWLDAFDVDYHVHLRKDNEKDMARAARLLTGRGNGLVLGGGAARGFAHLGTYHAMIDSGISVDWIGGASIGAILGAAIALDEGPEAATERARHAFVEGRPFGDYTLPLISLLSGRRMTRLTRHHLPGNIEDLPIPFFAISSNISTGHVNVHERGEIWRATNASAALPGILPPMIFGSQLAMDGAVLNNLPVDIMEAKPVSQVFAVELSASDPEFNDFSEIPSAWQALLQRLRPFSRSNDGIPGLGTLVLKSIEIATRSRSRDLGERADVLFSPPVQQYGLLNVDNFDRIVQTGYEHATAVLAEAKARQGQEE